MIPELSFLAARVREFIRSCSRRGEEADFVEGDVQGSPPPHVCGYGAADVQPGSRDSFQRLALNLFALQFRHVEPYRRLCEARGVKPETVLHWTEIPTMPTAAFKEFELSSLALEERTHWFRSSGTTGQVASRHFHSAESLALYEDSLLAWWRVNVLVTRNESCSQSGKMRLAEARGSFPLTPALSREERESLTPFSGESVRGIGRTVRFQPEDDQSHHPLAKGESRGEEGRTVTTARGESARTSSEQTEPVRLIMLTPPSESTPHSSLVHMFATLRREFGSEGSVFLGKVNDDGGWGVDAEAAVQCLSGHAQTRSRRSEEADSSADPSHVGGFGIGVAPVIVMGTAFSFVHLLDWVTERGIKLRLPAGSRVMETGGYKGRSRELSKAELHRLIADRLGVAESEIVCEYGMSELGSQAYDSRMRNAECGRRNEDGPHEGRSTVSMKIGGHGPDHSSPLVPLPVEGKEEPAGGQLRTRVFRFPPWARVRIVSPESGEEVGEGEVGLIQVFDLANVWSVMAVQTEDLGVRRGDGFEFVGRAALAESRGCSLMAV